MRYNPWISVTKKYLSTGYSVFWEEKPLHYFI